jgi:hypothetical protein
VNWNDHEFKGSGNDYLDAYREAQKWCGIDDSDGPKRLVMMVRSLGEQALRLRKEVEAARQRAEANHIKVCRAVALLSSHTSEER